ncbi:MAG: hypothetical protein ICV56_05210 [Nitrososphaeraceae archaeon]|nr:hypothetical protein [Nitrososphaeraceae archaeon]
MTNISSNSPRDSSKSSQYETVSAIENIFRSTTSSVKPSLPSPSSDFKVNKTKQTIYSLGKQRHFGL